MGVVEVVWLSSALEFSTVVGEGAKNEAAEEEVEAEGNEEDKEASGEEAA